MPFQDNEKSSEYIELLLELKELVAMGKNILFEGKPSTPEYVAGKCVLCEDYSYMRDYLFDDDGNFISLDFTKIS